MKHPMLLLCYPVALLILMAVLSTMMPPRQPHHHCVAGVVVSLFMPCIKPGKQFP